ncbi:ArsO family NAD(P)H-dependent flavin-containing monooxygenase [Rubrivirga sp. S365]|uniref:ArsO family NAD(P)H-dependent flavin-containing monooxygenase n=1 Tax=Rubrivirga sp. S365 TaxID=3076080 RepID=UPI0028C600FB|nr:ArsO family NAD(P)H-dependent flavin-containing monooxygenase [Rubrivirga sp. S365]MDT7858091.1 ArsO family NAD(P)H-dependent flavin-containing monooxygenase [Rubrivirga sp. S365]
MTTEPTRTLADGEPLPFATRDVVVVGGGQAALAVGYHLARELRKTDATVALLDRQPGPGGAWRGGWDSLRLFSPAEWSSLPGYLLPRHLAGREAAEYPHRDDVLDYLAAYEERYELPVWRPVRVTGVRRVDGDPAGPLWVETDRGAVAARAVVAATGTAGQPFVPEVPGRGAFGGVQVHSSAYRLPDPFTGCRVLVVGGGNSGAQVLAEVSAVADASWVVEREPRLLPADVNGRVLFDAATARYHALQNGEDAGRPYGLGDIVQVPPVRAAREAGRLDDLRSPIARFTADGVVWTDGSEEAIDAVVWCTGFRPALGFLDGLGVVGSDGRVAVGGTRSVAEPRLWLVGYGSWTGFASATLVGVGRSARATARKVAAALAETPAPISS